MGYKDSIEEAIICIFRNNKGKILEVRDMYNQLENYYELTKYQKEDDTKYPFPRYKHMVRSIIAQLKKKEIIIRIGYNQYKLKETQK